MPKPQKGKSLNEKRANNIPLEVSDDSDDEDVTTYNTIQLSNPS